MNKALIFVGGLLIGAAAGSGITYLVCLKSAKDAGKELAKEVSHEFDHENALRMDEEELREYYIQQLRDLGAGVYNAEEDEIPDDVYRSLHRTRVNPLPDDEDDEDEDDIYEMDDAPAPIDPNPFPYIITEKEFDKNDDYSTCTIHYYKEDETFTDDNYDIIDNISDILGRTEDDVKSSPLEAVYVRNEYQTCDYEVLIFNDSYKHAVEGEEPLGDMAD